MLCAEISRHLNRPVAIGGRSSSLVTSIAGADPSSTALVVLLTKDVLVTPACVAEIYTALNAGLPLISILVDSGGYSFDETRERLSRGEVGAWKPSNGSAEEFAAKLRNKLGVDDNFKLSDVQEKVYSSLSTVIARPWTTNGSDNQFDALVADVCSRIPVSRKLSTLRPRFASTLAQSVHAFSGGRHSSGALTPSAAEDIPAVPSTRQEFPSC